MAIKLVRPARSSRRTVLPLAAGLNIFSSMPMISSSCCRAARQYLFRAVLRGGNRAHAVKTLFRPARAAQPCAIAPGIAGLAPRHLPGRPYPSTANSTAYFMENMAKHVIACRMFALEGCRAPAAMHGYFLRQGQQPLPQKGPYARKDHLCGNGSQQQARELGQHGNARTVQGPRNPVGHAQEHKHAKGCHQQ